MNPQHPYTYEEAFRRNLGLIALPEQQVLRNACVALAGAGGVGGLQLLTLARMGVGRFHIADFDQYDVSNINRQFGATVQTIGQSKTQVMSEMLRAINPAIEIRIFETGIQPDNIDAFLEGADIVIDGIDFFAYDARRLLFNTARRKGLYALTSGPIGFGATLQIFSPMGMGFDEFFGISDQSTEHDKLICFIAGIAPAFLHLPYLDMSQVDPLKKRGPVVTASCMLASGIIATETIRILLKRTPPVVIPHYFQFDAYRHIYKKGYLPGGARNPLQVLKRWFLRRRFKNLTDGPAA